MDKVNEKAIADLLQGKATLENISNKPIQLNLTRVRDCGPSSVTIKLTSDEEKKNRPEEIKKLCSIQHESYSFKLKESAGNWMC
jgi:hypothetical protein